MISFSNARASITNAKRQVVAFATIKNKVALLAIASNTRTSFKALSNVTNKDISRALSNVTSNKISLETLHKRLGHLNKQDCLRTLSNTNGLPLLAKDEEKTPFVCKPCILANKTKEVSRETQSRATSPLQLLHIDLMGPLTPTS